MQQSTLRTIFWAGSLLLIMLGCRRAEGQMEVLPLPSDSVWHASQILLAQEAADDPYDEDVQYALSYVLAIQGDSAGALSALEKARAEDDDEPAYNRLAAFLFAWKGDFEQALAIANPYWELNPSDWELRVAMGNWHAQLGDYRLALGYYNEALAHLPNYGPFQLKKGEVFLQHFHDTLQAETWITKAVDQETGWGPATKRLVDLYIATNRVGEAQAVLTAQSIRNPDDPQLWRQQAQVYQLRNLPDSALFAWHQVRNLAPGPTVYLTLGEAHRRGRQWDSVQYYADEVLQVDSTAKDAWRLLARMADTRYRYTAAVGFYNQILSIDSADQIAREELAIVQRKVAYLRRLRAQEDSARTTTEAPSFRP